MSQPNPYVLIPTLPQNYKETDGVEFDSKKVNA
jgi:hypothetical protein